tara:strand:+ start:11494 stop:11859 length:366 start_codon:yes stop_codon:yes gene_type:complete
MIVNIINKSCIQLKVDSKIYSSEVLHKCFYWYGDKYSVTINKLGDFFVIDVSELSKDGHIEIIIDKIKKDIIDFKTREIIYKETKNIREILIVKAFSHNDEFAINPPGDVNDPVGFDPTKI